MLNRCDFVQNHQVKDFSDPVNKEGLDYFICSVCEECCDSVPRGVTVDHYKYRVNNSKLSARENCPANVRFDICTVLPKTHFFKLEETSSYNGFPFACPTLEGWYRRNISGWVYEGWIPVSSELEKFLKARSQAAMCGIRQIWQKFVALESAQRCL